MRLRFKVQPYQSAAVDAVADCFAGQPRLDPAGGANAGIALTREQLLRNIRAVQRGHGLPLSCALAQSPAAAAPDTPNLDIEMETGTGKTYVYIKTLLELNKRYGWSKFIVVVPSVAIREGVSRSFAATAEHFQLAYGSKPKSFCYNSSFLPELERFAADPGVRVMIINIQAFNAAGRDERRIYDVLDALQSRRPIDVISASRPVVVIDEPQRIGSVKALEALSRLNPLMVLRYSATHRVAHDLVYRLDALDAYRQRLVKKIAVRGISVRGLTGTSAYLCLDAIEVAPGYRPRARAELEVRTAAGVRRLARRLALGADLYEVSGGLEAYRGLVVTDIDASRAEVEFASGAVIAVGQVTADVTDEVKRRIQVREVIRAHLEKERSLFPLGIKVLSLFFIDEVVKYRDYNRTDTLGDYARAFVAEYRAQATELLGVLARDPAMAGYRGYLAGIAAQRTHRGYFSVDRAGRAVDGDARRSGESADAAAYDLILRDKERLLSLDEPVRFIFSHSALREGWDNPNVFVLGMLKRSDNTVSRRQEIGRGLRLAVDQHGERTDDPATVHVINELTVVTDESYTAFVDGLQRELSGSPGARPAAYPRPADGRRPQGRPRPRRPAAEPAAGQQAAFDSADLVRRCVAALNGRLRVTRPRYVVQQGEQREAGFTATGSHAHPDTGPASSEAARDLIGEITARTGLTRRTVASVLRQVSPATFARYGQNPAEFIAEAARLISEQRDAGPAGSG